MGAVGQRVVAAVAKRRVEAESGRLARDVALGQVEQGRVDGELVALDPGLGRQVRQRLERRDELRPAVGIARIIERVDADEDVARAARLGEAEGEAQEDGVARRDVGHRNALAHARLRHRDVAGQRRAAERGEIERHDDMAVRQALGDRRRRLELDPMPLAVVHGQRGDRKAGLARQRGADHRIEPAG